MHVVNPVILRPTPIRHTWGSVAVSGAMFLLLQAVPLCAQTPAFPGAEGFGRFAEGGRRGSAIAVTNTLDSGPGSLRAACQAKGPRTVIFKVSGIINLDSALTITEPYLTIAGQTAPGDGVCLSDFGCIIENTHDIILRFLRMRPGDRRRVEQDALSVFASRNIIIDHCSASWGTDETLSVTRGGTTNVSVQWCMITESLNNSVHHKGPHGYGSLLRVDGDLSFHHNLYAHHNSRNPRPGCYGDMERGSVLDFRNNVIYDWGERPGYTAADKASINYVGNYLRPGPSTLEDMHSIAFYVGGVTTRLFVQGNLHEGLNIPSGDDWRMVRVEKPSWTDTVRITRPLVVAPVHTDPPGQAFDLVLKDAGATLPARDGVDNRVASEVRSKTGHIIDSQTDVGGWPAYAAGVPSRDADEDGMPDAWEAQHGLNPADRADALRDPDHNGYTNLEEYLNAAAAARPGGERGSRADTIPASAPWSRRIADSFVFRHPDAATYDTGFTEQKWNYEQGLMLWSLYQMSLHSGEAKYCDFIEKNLRQYVEPDGRISTYKRTDYNLDLVAPGRALLAVYARTGGQQFRMAADTLRQQLREQPRTREGGFWHKKIYPYQMWLDGLFMAGPFYAMYTKLYGPPDAFDDIANQFLWIGRHARDFATGLYFHGWDESKEQPWADPVTGCSPSLWGRAMGWYIMGLVDVLDYIPADHPKRDDLIALLNDVSSGLLHWRDKESHLWFTVLDQGKREGNYLESSSSCMFTYAFAKGARLGYLPEHFSTEAQVSFEGILRSQISVEGNGFVDLHHTIKGAGLGGKPYRDGSFAYYVGESQRTNDMKGLGPFLLAAIELEKRKAQGSSKGLQ